MENNSSNDVSISSFSWGVHDFATSKLVSVHSTFLLVLLFLSLFVLKAKSKTSKSNNQAPLPPGPTPWPIVGNLPEIWRNKPVFRWIHGLMKELNTDIACIRLANTHVITVTSPEIAREFLKKFDSVFASRPLSMATEYSSRMYLSTAVVPWGDQWKKMRKVVASEIVDQSTLRRLLKKRTEEADNLVRFINNLCKSRGDDNSTSSAVINLRIVNGYHDPLIEERVQEWREGKREEPEDLLDAFILAKDSSRQPALSVVEIKAQITVRYSKHDSAPEQVAQWLVH